LSTQESPELKVLKEILKWTKFTGQRQVQGVLESALPSPEMKLAYQLSDGGHGSVEVGKESRVGSKDKVVDIWADWFRQGLGDFVPVKGGERFKRAFDLKDFGIDFPKIQQSPLPPKPTTSNDADKSKPTEEAPQNA
jgi:hypothetical protein